MSLVGRFVTTGSAESIERWEVGSAFLRVRVHASASVYVCVSVCECECVSVCMCVWRRIKRRGGMHVRQSLRVLRTCREKSEAAVCTLLSRKSFFERRRR